MHRFTVFSTAMLLAFCAQAEGVNNPHPDKLLDSTHCVIAKQIHRQSGTVLTMNRVCGKMYDTVHLFSDAQSQRTAPTDAFGTSHLDKATIRFIKKESQYSDADGRWVRIEIKESGAFNEKHSNSLVKFLPLGQAVRIATASMVDLELISDVSHHPNSFEQNLYSRMGSSSGAYTGYGYPTAAMAPWNPWSWQNTERKERERILYNGHPMSNQYPPR